MSEIERSCEKCKFFVITDPTTTSDNGISKTVVCYSMQYMSFNDLCLMFGAVPEKHDGCLSWTEKRAIKSGDCIKKPPKPPLGVMTRSTHDRIRLELLASAIERRTDACCDIPPEWIEEYNEIVKRYGDKAQRLEKATDG